VYWKVEEGGEIGSELVPQEELKVKLKAKLELKSFG
jgi:hypothetical protein